MMQSSTEYLMSDGKYLKYLLILLFNPPSRAFAKECKPPGIINYKGMQTLQVEHLHYDEIHLTFISDDFLLFCNIHGVFSY